MKRAIVQISDDLLVEILKGLKSGFNGRFKVIKNGLPEDVKLIRAYPVRDQIIEMILESESFKDIADAPIPVLDPPQMSAIPADDSIMWLCGQLIKSTEHGSIWDFQGLFYLRDDAIKACKNENYFVAPVEMDKELPREMQDWSVIEYPLQEVSDNVR